MESSADMISAIRRRRRRRKRRKKIGEAPFVIWLRAFPIFFFFFLGDNEIWRECLYRNVPIIMTKSGQL